MLTSTSDLISMRDLGNTVICQDFRKINPAYE